LNYVISLHAITLLPGYAGRTVLLVATFRRVLITDIQYKYRYRRVSVPKRYRQTDGRTIYDRNTALCTKVQSASIAR